MRNVAAFFVFVLLLTGISNAQEQLPTEKKVTFGQNGEMFVNKELGVYLWLSTSPEKDAKKHRLTSDSTNIYANPMFLDTEGYNTLRSPSAVDPKTRKTVYPVQDIVFEVYADGLSPNSKYKFVNGKSIYRTGKLYYSGKALGLTLSAIDKVSGIEKTYYSINRQNYIEYKDTVRLSSEGETGIKFYSTDRVGNRELPIEKTITIDNSAPKTTCEIVGAQNEKFVSSNALIKLSSNDSLIGVKTIYYQINNGAKRAYTAPISASLLGDGGSVSFYAIDHLNNKEEIQTVGGKGSISTGASDNFEFYVDKDAPSVAIDLDGAFSKGKYTYVAKNTKIKVNAEDDKSGVDKVNYSINSTTINQQYGESIEFSDDGIAYIRVNATDYVGNTSATITKAYYVDASAPSTTISVLQPKHKVKDTLFVTSNTNISLTSSDKASGVSEINYKVNNGEIKTYSSPFNVTGKGLVKIEYFAKDNVNNTEEAKILELHIDDIPPIIFHHYSATPIGTKTVREQELTIYPSNMKLYIAATDKASGGERVEYKINNGPVKSVNPIKGLVPGNYEVKVTAYDVLGNSSSETINFSVED